MYLLYLSAGSLSFSWTEITWRTCFRGISGRWASITCNSRRHAGKLVCMKVSKYMGGQLSPLYQACGHIRQGFETELKQQAAHAQQSCYSIHAECLSRTNSSKWKKGSTGTGEIGRKKKVVRKEKLAGWPSCTMIQLCLMLKSEVWEIWVWD